MGSSLVAVTKLSLIAPVCSKEFVDIPIITDDRFTLNAYVT